MPISIQNPRYFHRDYEHDLPAQDPQTDYATLQRVALVALPFTSLYQPLGRALAIGCSSIRAITSSSECISSAINNGEQIEKSVLNLTLAISSVAGSVFLNPLGILITTAHDVSLNISGIIENVKEESYEDALKEGVKLLNNSAYLLTMVYGSLELQIASLAIQVIFELGCALQEYESEHYLEAGAHLAMGAIRSYQMMPFVELLQRKWEIEAAVKNIFVGELKEKWQFPSDHLPVGVLIDDEYEVVSWNVMNNEYMKWVKEVDSQGLNGSLITELDIQVNAEGLTQRDVLVAEMVESMIKPSSGIISLQECGEPFLAELESRLPESWKIVRSFDRPAKDQEVTLYNISMFSFEKDLSETSFVAYPSDPGRLLMNSAFRKRSDGKIVRVINSHIPGNPDLPGRFEFAEYVKRFLSPGQTTIALGDNNFERHEMREAFSKSGIFDAAGKFPIEVLHTSWPTNIDPVSKASKGIDHTLVIGAQSRALETHEVLQDERLQQTIDLLKTPVK